VSAADVLPHDLSGWITLAIALLSAFLGWMNNRKMNGSAGTTRQPGG